MSSPDSQNRLHQQRVCRQRRAGNPVAPLRLVEPIFEDASTWRKEPNPHGEGMVVKQFTTEEINFITSPPPRLLRYSYVKVGRSMFRARDKDHHKDSMQRYMVVKFRDIFVGHKMVDGIRTPQYENQDWCVPPSRPHPGLMGTTCCPCCIRSVYLGDLHFHPELY